MNVPPSMARAAYAPAPRHKRRTWLLVLLGVLIFACGIAVGAGATLYVVQRMVTDIVREPDKMADRMAHHMERKLRLTGEQRAEVEAIVSRRIDGLLDIRRDIRPRIVEQLDQLEAEMREVLTPGQMREWQSQLNLIKEILIAPDEEQ
ncbi:MAG: hypothetical protein JW889_07730 [Verrucomicrobia bacterium]|nr:hypothetical protein [Verrucomicrobiota bacterium]